MLSLDTVIIGSGVVGLACARSLAMAGRDVYVLEQANSYGQGISSRNSEVIHAGLYYPSSSLKAKLCLSGANLLYEYCEKKGIPHKRLGKWVVADETQESRLNALCQHAINNGCEGVSLLSKREIAKGEPELRADIAIKSPNTGIMDSHAYMTSLLGDFQRADGTIVFRTTVRRIDVVKGGYKLTIGLHNDEYDIKCCNLVNSAGLAAVPLLQNFIGFPKLEIPKYSYAKGNYFSYAGVAPFRRLIYPMPEVGGLGVHLTLDMAGHARFGPDVEWVDDPSDLRVGVSRALDFASAIKKYWPTIQLERLVPDYAGMRPKLGDKNSESKDFLIQTADQHSLLGLVNLLGIESPGLTSSLAIGELVAQTLK
jgi:L-2-hydroxyglutarate oxidase LhgO